MTKARCIYLFFPTNYFSVQKSRLCHYLTVPKDILSLELTGNVWWETLSCLTIINFQKSSILTCSAKLAIKRTLLETLNFSLIQYRYYLVLLHHFFCGHSLKGLSWHGASGWIKGLQRASAFSSKIGIFLTVSPESFVWLNFFWNRCSICK